jgi:uncharacterized membrane-anchored protein
MTVRHLSIAVVVGVQLLALAAIPARALRTRAVGQDVSLWTAPVDPYDVLSGYYVTLTYEAESTAAVDTQRFEQDEDVWVTIRRGDPAWTRTSIGRERPAPSPDELSLRARWAGWRVQIVNAGRLYIPEDERDRASKLLGDVNGRALVDMKVDSDGNVSVLRLRVGDATFGEPR